MASPSSTKPIAVQLYSVRDALQTNFAGTLRRLQQIGYTGVEFAGVYGDSPQGAAALCAELGLTITSAHLGLPRGESINQVVETAQALGINTIVCAWMPPERFRTEASVRAVSDELNEAAEIAAEHGLRFAYHNHDFEFHTFPDIGVAHEWMRDHTSHTVMFELDSYWTRVAGQDPAATLRELGGRVPLVHLKDGDGLSDGKLLPVGTGVMDIPAVLAAAHPSAALIVELDHVDGDMFAALEESYQHVSRMLAEQGAQ